MSVRRMEPNLPGQGRAIRPRSPVEMLEPARAPSRPQGRRVRRESGRLGGLVRLLSGLLTTGLVVLGLVGGLGFLAHYQFEAPGPLDVSRTVVVSRGDGRIEIATMLEREGIIANRWTFIVNHLFRTRVGSERLDLKAGEYEIAKGASMREVMRTLTEGRAVLYKLTLPEGLTSQQIVERMQAEESLSGDIAAIPPEGSLLPDTYSFSKGMARGDLIERMQLEQRRLIEAAWPKRQEGLPFTTPEEAIILASIVEKETGVPEERSRVAAVFVNRLRKGMRLQSDPTIIYGIVGGQGSLGRSITRSDIDQKTAYNTYTINGLPPTPICNPGREAILAVLDPASTKDLFFVADGSGGHAFSETLAAHNAAVANWRKIEREARDKEKADVVTAIPGAPQQRAASREVARQGNDAEPAPVVEAVATAAAATPGATADDGQTGASLTTAVAPPLPIRKPRP
ncbi:MAG: endolytic transglycosylase MltG [Hyphomicrobiaceae bacterium]|nr:endolytic transglycosylase MltG [Hyphomicrobiaceae bacterium]